MATNTAGSSARAYSTAQTHIISLPFTFATMLTGGASPPIGTVPANCSIIRATVAIRTAFNSGTNNQVGLGVTAGGVTLAALATLNTVGNAAVTLVAGAVQVPTVDTTIYLANGYTGTQATTGDGTIYIEYLIPDSVAV